MKAIWGALVIVGGAMLAGCAGDNTAQMHQNKTGNGMTFAFSAIAAVEVGQGKNDFKLTVTDATSHDPMPGLTITVKPSMPSDGMTTKGATVTESGNGVYEAHSVDFSMPGDWQVEYHASMPDMQDTVDFMYSVP
jgi:hypothetical protein